MMKKSIWGPAQTLAICILAASILTACTVSVSGGVIGSVFSIILLLFLFAGAATTASGCDPDDGDPAPTADAGPDAYLGPCLSAPPPEMGVVDTGGTDAHLGPCLSAPPPEMGVMDAEVGPCLQPPPPEMDAEVGPCLQPPPPEMDAAVGPCLSQLPPDMGMEEDAAVGPCLSQIPPDAAVDAAADAEADAEPDAGVVEPPVGPCLSPPAPGREPDQPERHGIDYQEAPPVSPETVDRKAALARILNRGGLPADVVSRLTSEQDDEQG